MILFFPTFGWTWRAMAKKQSGNRMNSISHRLGLSLLALLMLSISASLTCSASNFVPIKLPHKVQIEIPRNWKVFSANLRTTLDATVQALSERAGVFDASSDLKFAANYMDEGGRTAALLNVRYYPDLKLTQANARAAGQAEIHELDAGLRDTVAKDLPSIGLTMLAWNGTRKEVINGAVAFITEYKRPAMQGDGTFRVRLVRIYNAGKSFTLTVSYRDDSAFFMQPICDRIISSLRIGRRR
jgi:hypothetical protein